MKNRVAIIDIGTNTFNLLVVDKGISGYNVIHTERIGVGLGHDGINKSIIAPPAFKRGLDCLKAYADTCNTSLSILSYNQKLLQILYSRNPLL